TVTVADTTKPIFTVEPQNKIVECDGLGNLSGPDGFNAWLASNAGAVATDNCGTVTISYLIEDTNTICGGAGSVIVDFIAKDECAKFTIKQAVFMILDRAPPVVTPASNLVIECSINGEDELNAWLSNNGGATATDTCGSVTWTHDYQGSLAVCGAPVTVTFTATDACGNTNTTQAAVSVVDTTAPALTGTAYAGVTGVNACMADAETAAPFNADFAAQGYTDCSGDVTIALVDTDVTGTNCDWTVTYTFTVTDACGNALENQSYSNSGSDQTAPALTGAAYAGVTGVNACRANAETAAPFDAALAVEGYTDNCGGDVTATLTGT